LNPRPLVSIAPLARRSRGGPPSFAGLRSSEQWRKWCLDERDRKPKAPEPVEAAPIDWDKAAAFFARTGRWWRDIT
jgi:hypothetical protein